MVSQTLGSTPTGTRWSPWSLSQDEVLGLQGFEARRKDNTQTTFILMLNMSQDLMTKLVIYIFQRYLNIKLLKIQIQIASYK